ncbi:Avr9/Cf-9 rapidly elicited protein 146 [Heracleum sosnowskyi]|uniref:Avr9/Cf-9 rapidly elicited protein 146 n=1 Tax=Heracleum sosnowskyi TaxID=360622 RepID=A0AAD8J6X2_9APIA|nr:Avr9/Cf-9 rapidly elicited protein 146 [Heracleum sosnowskyi]
MEVEECSSTVATKMSNTISIVLYMLKKGFSRSKLKIYDLHTKLKQEKHATNTVTNLMLQHHYAASSICRSTDVAMSYVSPPKDYEFSCSNTPLIRRRRKRYYQYRHTYNHQKVFVDDIKLSEYESVEASPAFSLPGFGRSPLTVRQLRVTDSPFSMKDADENTDTLDKAAEEFIKKFYKELEKQKRMAPPFTYSHRRTQ